MYTRVLANLAVADLESAEDWYSALFERRPDARPMPGLLEWHLSGDHGVQVWADEARAGHGAAVLGVNDLDADAARLQDAGVDHDGPQPGGGARILQIADPDGNALVLTGA